jgi:hypothetical protein
VPVASTIAFRAVCAVPSTSIVRSPVARVEPRDLDRVVEVVDDLVPSPEHRVDVELTRRSLRRAGDPPRLVECLRRAKQRLRRHACVVRALAADEMPLDDGDGQAVLAEAADAHLAGRAGADHDDVELRHQSGSARELTKFACST